MKSDSTRSCKAGHKGEHSSINICPVANFTHGIHVYFVMLNALNVVKFDVVIDNKINTY